MRTRDIVSLLISAAVLVALIVFTVYAFNYFSDQLVRATNSHGPGADVPALITVYKASVFMSVALFFMLIYVLCEMVKQEAARWAL